MTGVLAAALATAAAGLFATGCGERDRDAVERDDEPPPAQLEAAPVASTQLPPVAVAAFKGTAPPEGPSHASSYGPTSVEERGITNEELRWAGDAIEWARTLAATVEAVRPYRRPIVRGSSLGAERRAIERALRRLERCVPHTRRSVGKAPTERLVPVEGVVRNACEEYGRGAKIALDLLADRIEREYRRHEAEGWNYAWEDGDDLMASLGESLLEFQPANAMPIPEVGGPVRRTRVEPELGRVASKVVDVPVEIRCWSRPDWDRLVRDMKRYARGRVNEQTAGFVGYGDRRANLSPPVCNALVALRYGKKRPTTGVPLLRAAFGVHVLMHEAQHAHGVWSEAAAECLGMQTIRAGAVALGARPAYARLLAESYWTHIYPHAPPEYRSSECRDGGRLDLRPARAVWP